MAKGRRLIRLMAVSLLACWIAAAAAEESLPLRVAILDVNEVLRNAAAVRNIRARLHAFMEAYRTDTQKEEEEVRAAQQELGRKRAILSAEAYEVERRQLEQRLAQAQANVQQRRRGLERAQAEGMAVVQGALNRIVTEIASEQSLTLILRKDQTVLVATPLEITDEVLRRLDARLPSVEIRSPEG